MCGPLALALPATGNSPSSFLLGRSTYNLGRVVTYIVLGFVFGLVGRTFFSPVFNAGSRFPSACS